MSDAGSTTRIGWLAGSCALLCPILAGFTGFLALRYEPLLVRSAIDPSFALRLAALGGIALGAELLLGIGLLRQQRARSRRSVGRRRFLALACGGIAHAFGLLTCALILWSQAKPQDLVAGFGLTLAPEALGVAVACAALASLGTLVSFGASIAVWLLVRQHTRRRIWVAVDLFLLVAAASAIALVPGQPSTLAPRDLALPIARHVITALFVMRLFARLLPRIMDLVERLGFRALVAARHLRSRKSGFLAAISLLSILAVTVSSCALTTTLSVMGGFRNDLKRKILGNNAHVVVDRDHAIIEGWPALVETTLSTPGVAGASPYVSGEVMLSSASNLATAILRGVEPSGIGKVNDLPRNLKTGSLDYLDHPEKLLELPSPGTTSLLRLSGSLRKQATKSGEQKTAPSARGGEARSTEDELDALEQKLDQLEEFLRKDEQASTKPENRDLLPGIIIGQELARALRLYLGDEVNVVAPLGALGPSGPMPKARPFRVAGIFYSGMYEYDMKFTYVSLPTAQRFLNLGDAINGIDVKTHDVDAAPAIANALRERIGRSELRVRDWQDLNSRLFGALALEKLAMFIALGIAILVASFCIAGTLTLMVQEKGREVAILKAMGTSDRAIVGVFVIEGGLIGVLGASLGLFLGYVVCFAAEHFGIRMNPEVYYIDRLPVHMDATEFTFTGLAAVAVCLLVTIYPALLASRLRPVDALRYE